jgi:hypothetical protein
VETARHDEQHSAVAVGRESKVIRREADVRLEGHAPCSVMVAREPWPELSESRLRAIGRLWHSSDTRKEERLFVNISVHRVKPDQESLMIDSMRRYGAAARSAGGVREIHTLKDERSGALLGLAIWESKEAYEAAGPALMEAVEGDDFDAWHEEQGQSYHCSVIR